MNLNLSLKHKTLCTYYMARSMTWLFPLFLTERRKILILSAWYVISEATFFLLKVNMAWKVPYMPDTPHNSGVDGIREGLLLEHLLY